MTSELAIQTQNPYSQDNNMQLNYLQMEKMNTDPDYKMMEDIQSTQDNDNFLAKNQPKSIGKVDKLTEDMNSVMNMLMTLAILDSNFDVSKLFVEEKTKKNSPKDKKRVKDFPVNHKMNMKSNRKAFDKMVSRAKSD